MTPWSRVNLHQGPGFLFDQTAASEAGGLAQRWNPDQYFAAIKEATIVWTLRPNPTLFAKEGIPGIVPFSVIFAP